MSRDTSVSKPNEGKAFENNNIRITARDHDTFLSVTNERGNKEVAGMSFDGTLIGWNKLNKMLVLFTHDEQFDRIYRVSYSNGEFTSRTVYEGHLNFSCDNPIESVVDYENEDIQKIYWVDGRNQLRFLNFADSYLDSHSGMFTDDWFDVNRSAGIDLSVSIDKGDSGNQRPNGTVQYFITFYNKHGQETSYVYCSPIVYLAPNGMGGSPDGTNGNKITLRLSAGTSSSLYDYVRVYALVRTAYNGSTNAYIVSENETSDGEISIVDDGKYLSAIDVTSLLYLGSNDMVASTITHKDNTLFLGDISSIGNDDDSAIRDAVKSSSFKENGWESSIVRFVLSGNTDEDRRNGTLDIPYVRAEGLYPYESQLSYTNDRISTFKGEEKYRFAIQFRKRNGTFSRAYWIGDVVNHLYPSISDGRIRRPVAVCNIPEPVIEAAVADGYVSAQLMIAQASYSDRSVKVQGIVNPTLFNLYDRYRDAPYLIPSWIARPRGGDVAFKHFMPLNNSNTAFSELQCSYWDNESPTPSPFMFKYNGGEHDGEIANKPSGYVDYKFIWIEYMFYAQSVLSKYWGSITVMKSSSDNPSAKDDFELKETYSFGGGSESYFASRLKCISDLKAIYVNANVPENYGRLTDQQIIDYCEEALHGATTFKPGSRYVDLGMSRVNYSVNNGNLLFSRLNREYFFVDEGSVTLNAPEIEYEKVNVDRMKGLKFRIVGVSRLTSDISDYIMESEDAKSSGEHVIKKGFSSKNISDRIHGVISDPMYVEKKIKEMNGSDKVHPEDIKDYTDDDYEFDFGNACYMMYMWHKSGSIIGFGKDAENGGWSRLKSKTFANLHFGYDTLYGGFWEDVPYDIRQCAGVGNQLYEVKTEDGSKGYLPNVDTLVITPNGVKYPIYYSEEDNTPGESLSLSTVRYSNDPVPVRFRSTPHALISLSSTNKKKTILPYIFGGDDNSERFVQPVAPANSVGPFVTWKTNDLPDEMIYTYKDGVQSDISTGLLDGFSILIKANGRADLNLDYSKEMYDRLMVIRGIASSYDELYGYFSSSDYGTCLIDMKNMKVSLVNAELKWSGYTGSDMSQVSWTTDTGALSYTDFHMSLYGTVNGSEELLFETGNANSQTSVMIAPSNGNSIRAHFTIDGVAGNTYSFDIVIVSDRDSSRSYDSGIDQHVLDDDYPSHGPDTEQPDIIDGDVTIDKKVMYSGIWNRYIAFTLRDARCIRLSGLTSSLNTMSVVDKHIYTLVVEGRGVSYVSDGGLFTANQYPDPIQSRFCDDEFANRIGANSKYLFIGELYYDYDAGDISNDTRYGGISESAVEANTFIVAGPSTSITGDSVTLYGNQGDTFFQRWDSVKTLPVGKDDVNSVVDITSVMLETHINLDGRYDNMRGNTLLASLDYSRFGMLNEAYSQENNFNTNIHSDVDMDMDNYRTYLTWTEEKHAGDETDKWTHITLASTLKLDGDKGVLRALRRHGNNMIAFQDRGISEIMFNSRVQLATGNGVPVELANSGKVDGKRYISERNGCKNKWSIVSGKNGLYYVDDINKNISLLSSEGIVDISGKSGLSTWVKEQIGRGSKNDYWTPDNNEEFISFYDDVNSDVYFYRWGSESNPCLVYSEKLGAFSSFFDYKDVPMMVNVEDRFVSYRDGRLWLQNEGLYGNFFGEEYGFGVTYRVTPDPYLDKIWTNVEYRSDFFEILDRDANPTVDESSLIGVNQYDSEMTFDTYRVWNEYQDTDDQGIDWNGGIGNDSSILMNDIRKFRIWRISIGRDVNDSLMLNRIRNPWVYLKLQKNTSCGGRHMMQLHDVMVKYFTTEDNE